MCTDEIFVCKNFHAVYVIYKNISLPESIFQVLIVPHGIRHWSVHVCGSLHSGSGERKHHNCQYLPHCAAVLRKMSARRYCLSTPAQHGDDYMHAWLAYRYGIQLWSCNCVVLKLLCSVRYEEILIREIIHFVSVESSSWQETLQCTSLIA